MYLASRRACAAEAAHAAWVQAAVQVVEMGERSKPSKQQALQDGGLPSSHERLAAEVRAELLRVSSSVASVAGQKSGAPADESANGGGGGSGRVGEVVGWVAARHGLAGLPVSVLTRSDLEGAELDLLLEVEVLRS